MSRAAPGDFARGVLRRDLPKTFQATARLSGSCQVRYPPISEMEVYLYRCGSRSQYLSSFTLQFSGFRVERGGLGEVVSLVGDCRPPPPGNPRRPTSWVYKDTRSGGRRLMTAGTVMGENCFTGRMEKNGETLLQLWLGYSFNSNQTIGNLKELKNQQYFKKNRSYTSCMGRDPVLKFIVFHSHLCGYLGMEPPPIAITNVLKTGR
jgi:hypothetical protein